MKKNFRLKELRLETGFKSQVELAKAANVGRLTILDMENFRGLFHPTVLVKVATALNIEIKKLFTILKYDKDKYQEQFGKPKKESV